MSSEGDSCKSVLSEANEKSGTDQTDSSQDSHDVTEARVEKNSTENDVEKKEIEEKSKEKVEDNNKPSDTKTEDSKTDEDKKPQTDADQENDKKEVVGKEEDKSENSDKDEEEDESEKSDKKDVPLLDQPLEKSGKRERKNVQRFNEDVGEGAKVDGGSGTSLGDIPRVDASISRFKNDDLKLLHKFLFNAAGKNTLIKKNIRKFNGFDFKKDSDEYTKKVASAHKFETKQLKSMCEMLDLQKTGSKDDIIERIIDFLLEPKDSGKAVGGGRPKRSAAVKANNRGYSSHDDYSSDEKQSSRARRDKGKRMNLKEDSSSDEDFHPNQSDASEEKPRISKRKRRNQRKDSSDDEASDPSVASSEESEDEPKSKRKKSPAKVNNKTKPKGRRGRPPTSAKKTPSRGKKAKADSEDEEESDHKEEGSSSEDEPLAKKAKSSQPPTDDELKTFIKSILEGANLEEITMKTVCQRVYGHYPDFDLTHKKDFIKTTVKSLIST